ncbi:MAG: hypothetical protein V4438_04265 [Patescibacteria group bacterium]
MKKIIRIIAGLILIIPAFAGATVLFPVNGGSGWGTPGGIQMGHLIYGNNLNPFATTSGEVTGYILQWNGAIPVWVSTTTLGNQISGNYITALTGDVTASGPGSAAATLATVNANVGSFTNANITVNGKGLVTAASNGTAGSTFGQAWELFSGALSPTTSVPIIVNNSTSTITNLVTVNASSTNATSSRGFFDFLRVAGTSTASQFNATSTTATSTFANGIEMSGGCYSFLGTCLQTYIQNATAYKSAANYATAAVLPGTPSYNNGSSGVGATLTEIGLGALTVDGQTVSVGQRILVKNEADQTTNGVYVVTNAGSALANYILTRSTDFNTSNDVYAGVTVPVLAGGTANGDTAWVQTTTGTITIGSSNITFIESSFGTNVVNSVSNSDGSLTISPTQGAVIASIALAHPNTWTGLQTINNASTTALTVSGVASTTVLRIDRLADGCLNIASGLVGSQACGGSTFGQSWEIGGAGGPAGFLSPTTTQKVYIGQASSTIFSTASTTWLALNGGTVGIGTTSPKALLAINPVAGNDDSFYIGSSTASIFRIGNNGFVQSNAKNNAINFTSEAGQPQLGVFTNDAQAVNKGGCIGLGGNIDNAAIDQRQFGNICGRKFNNVTNSAGGYLAFSTASGVGDSMAEVARMTNAGNLGVGDTTPDFRLETVGINNQGYFGITSLTGSDGDILFVNNAGNFGIGSTSPFSTLSVSTTTNSDGTFSLFAVASSTNASLFNVYGNGNVAVGSTTPWATLAVNPLPDIAANQFVVGSSTATNFIVKNDGKVGIGTTTPFATLAVNTIAGVSPFSVGSSTGTYFNINSIGNVGISANNYLNFGAALGSTGYGFRDNSGSIEVADSSTTPTFVPVNDYQMSDRGYRALGSKIAGETLYGSVSDMTTNNALTDNAGRFSAIYIPKQTTIVGCEFFMVTQGSYTADQTNQCALYSYSGGTLTQVASSTNNGNLWKAANNTFIKEPFALTYSASPGLYFVATLYNNSAQVTAPTLGSFAAFLAASVSTQDFTNSAKLSASLGTQNTLTTSSAASALGNTTARYWAAVYSN